MSIWSPPLQITESEARLLAEIERLRGLLREARQRTQNLLHRQHGDAIIMNPDEYLRATLSWLDDALAESGHESGQNGPSAADQPAAAQCDHAWVYSDLARDWNCTKCGRSGITADNAAAQPAAAHPNALAGEAGDARLGRIAMRFVDRAGDYCEVDPAERICDEFSKAMGDEIERQWRERMARDAATADNAAAQPAAAPDFKAWREAELRYVIEACKAASLGRATNESRDALLDLRAWAMNRLSAADNAAAQPDAGPQAPIIRVSVDEFGSARVVKHYAPGLPFGEHELYCEPEATAPIIREEPDAAPKPKRAYHETHEPPHCPTCECWQEITPDNSPAGQEG